MLTSYNGEESNILFTCMELIILWFHVVVLPVALSRKCIIFSTHVLINYINEDYTVRPKDMPFCG